MTDVEKAMKDLDDSLLRLVETFKEKLNEAVEELEK